MKKARTLAPVAAAIAVATAGLASPALASAANSPSPIFAGYQFNNYVAVPATVSATIVVPTLKCTAGPERDIWPGVGMQSVSSFVGLDMFCKNGAAHYSPFLEVENASKLFGTDTAHPGDVINFKLYESTGYTTGTVVDKTHAFTATKTGAGSGTGDGPKVGDSAIYLSGVKAGIPNFGTITFTHALANGSSSTPGPFGALNPTGYNMYTTSPSSPLQVLTDPFGTSKESFKTVFKHS